METHGRDLRFLGLFALFMVLYFVLSTTSLMKDRFFPWYLEANARASTAVLHGFGCHDVVQNGKSVTSPRGAVTVARGCDAMEPVALFISAVLASPVSWSARVLAAIAGTGLLLFINLVRIISLFVCNVRWKAAFDIMHLDVWQALFIFVAIFFWAVWAAWAVKRQRRKHVHAPA
jgi:exosortase/archaeosortase family protein